MSNKSYIKEVAKLLGVEIGEVFTVKINCEETIGSYMVSDTGLKRMNAKGDCWVGVTDNTLELLLNETYAVVKKPWIPEEMGYYYWIDNTGRVHLEKFVSSVFVDSLRVHIGNSFRTREEAEANVDKWLAYMKQEPDLSWRT